MKPKCFISMLFALVAAAAHAQDVVPSIDIPALHITYDNLGVTGQPETLTNSGSTLFLRRLRFDTKPATDNTQMALPFVDLIGRYDANATGGAITQATSTLGLVTPQWETDNTISAWFGGPGAGALGSLGFEGRNGYLTFQGQAGCGANLSRTNRAQLCYDLTAGALRLSMNGGAWTSLFAGTPGTVTSVGLAMPSIFTVSGSPVTTTGTLTAALASQTANLMFASPNGSSGAPLFRAWVPADAGSQTANTFLAAPNGAAGAPTFRALATADYGTGTVTSTSILDGTILFADWNANACTANQVPSRNAGNTAWVCSSPAGTGTVTSVGLALPTQFTVTGSPVTGAGTLTGAWNTQTANTILAGPTTGAAAAPTFRALVAADIPGGVGSTLWCTPDISAAQFPTTAAAYFSTTVSDHTTLDFVNGSATGAYYLCTLPTSYDATSLVVALNWSTSAVTGNVVWGINIEKQDGLTATNAFGATAGNGNTQTTATVAANATTNTISQSTVTYTNSNAGGVVNLQTIRIRVQRVGNSGSDTVTAVVNLHSLFVRK